jgi:fatty acid/phospholipid biosynthesis enzyme
MGRVVGNGESWDMGPSFRVDTFGATAACARIKLASFASMVLIFAVNVSVKNPPRLGLSR